VNKHRLISALVLMGLLAGMVTQGANGTYADDSQTPQQTGQTVGGFLTYWDSGGLSQQGYPHLPVRCGEQSDTDGKTYTVQYFEELCSGATPRRGPYINFCA